MKIPAALTKAVSILDCRPRGNSAFAYFALVAAICAAVLIIGFRVASQVNHDTDAFDQGAYILMSQKLEGSWWPWYNDGTRNPLFPWLASVFLDANSPDFFAKGKNLNVVLAAICTAAFGIFFSRRLGLLTALNLTALAAFGVLLPSATFFGAETLHYTIFFFLWVVGVTLLIRNSIGLYTLFGLLAALSYLAKPSMMPLLALFILFSAVRLGLHLGGWLRVSDWRPIRVAPGIALLLVLFAAICMPRFIHSQRTWGKATYSLPEYWFWADDWDTCVAKYYDCRSVKLATMPIEEQPTLKGYFHRHTFADAVYRVTNGTRERVMQFLIPEGRVRIPYDSFNKVRRVVLPHRGFYFVAFAGLLLVAAAFVIRERKTGSLIDHAAPMLFILAIFAAYTVTSAWYWPITGGHRFMLPLFLPAVWFLAWGINRMEGLSSSAYLRPLMVTANLAIAVMLSWRLLVLLFGAGFEKVSYTF